MGTDARREFELAVIGALLAYDRRGRGMELDAMTPTHVYGWVPKPAPAGWTVRQARLACERLAQRGQLVAIPGRAGQPRRYVLGEDFASACPADGCPGLEWHREAVRVDIGAPGGIAHGELAPPRPCGCGHPTKTSGCEGFGTSAYLEWKTGAGRVG
jgi:hypothetical protein